MLSLALAVSPANTGTVRGTATWFDATRNNAWYTRAPYSFPWYIAAGPAMRVQHKNVYRQHYWVQIKNVKTGKWAIVPVTDWCSCNGSKRKGDERIGDLSPALFTYLCNCKLGRGIQTVEVKLIDVLGSPDAGHQSAFQRGR